MFSFKTNYLTYFNILQIRKCALMSLFLIVISTIPAYTQPIGIGSITIPGLFDSQVINHQGHRFGETMFLELMNPNLYPFSTPITQNHELTHGYQAFIKYSYLHNDQQITPNTKTMSWSLPVFSDQLVEISLTSPVQIPTGLPVYEIGIPLETPEAFWPVIDEINEARNMVFISSMDQAWEQLLTGNISTLVTSAQTLISWSQTQECETIAQHQVSRLGPVIRGHFVSPNAQLIAQINFGIRLLGASNKLEQLGNQFFGSENTLCGPPIPFDFFITY